MVKKEWYTVAGFAILVVPMLFAIVVSSIKSGAGWFELAIVLGIGVWVAIGLALITKGSARESL